MPGIFTLSVHAQVGNSTLSVNQSFCHTTRILKIVASQVLKKELNFELYGLSIYNESEICVSNWFFFLEKASHFSATRAIV